MKSNLKKILSVSLATLMIATLFTACKSDKNPQKTDSTVSTGLREEIEKVKVNVGVLKDVSAFGMLKLMHDDKGGYANNDYTFDVYTSTDKLIPNIQNKTVDIAVIPTAVAAKYYNENDKSISVIAVSSIGTYTLVTNGVEISSFADLKGKTIYTAGKGSEVEKIINHIIEKNSLKAEELTIEYKDSFADVEASVISGDAKLAILPQPNVANAIRKNGSVSIALDLAVEWAKIPENSELTIDCIIARKDFIEKNKDALKSFIAEYYASTYNTTDKISETVSYADEFGILVPEIAEKVIPFSNSFYSIGKDMKASISNYLSIVSTETVDDGFYYLG